MTERHVQNALYDWLIRKGTKLCCPNYTPLGWFECDLWAMTEAGYSTEFEIKLTRADFKKDVEKIEKLNWKDRRAGKTPQTKHARLVLADNQCPSRFFYVTPAGLIKQDEIPEWAGHIELTQKRAGTRINLDVKKPAPQLHKDKVDQKVIDHCKSVFYYRYWTLRQKVWPCNGPQLLEDGESYELDSTDICDA